MIDPPAGLRQRIAAGAVGPIGLMLGLYLLLGIGVVGPRITTDGLLYFAEARSAVLDGDLDVADEYRFDPTLQIPGASEGRREFLPRDLDGRFLHTANEGMVVLFAPLILAGHVVAGLIAALGGAVSMDGYDLPYVLAVGFGTNAMVAIGLAILVGYVRRYVGLAAAAGGAAAIWVGSSLLHWSVFRPGHAHAPAVLLEALFVVLFLARARDPRDRAAWLAMGAVWGLAVSVRPITGLYAIVPLFWLGWLAARPIVEAVREAVRHGVAGRGIASALAPALMGAVRLTLPAGLLFLAGGLVGRLPQVAMTGDLSLAGSAYYEESGYLGSPGGDNPLAGVSSLLLDPSQGTLWWVPLVPLAIIGLAWYWRRDRLVTVAGLLWVVAIWVVVGMLGYPQRFGGPTYASRHLVEATPIYVLGAAGLVPLVRAAVASLAAGRHRLGTIAAAALLASTAAWGFIQYIASEAVPGAAGLDPLARMARILSGPGSLRRLLVGGPAGAPEPGPAFVGGRVAVGLGEGNNAAEVAIALVMLVGLGIAAAAIGRVGLAWVVAARPAAAEGRGADAARWGGRAAWVLVAAIAVALVAPTIGRPRLAEPAADRAISTWVAGTGRPAEGRIERIVLGSSPTGNEVVSPPPAEPGAPDPNVAQPVAVAFADLPADGLSATIRPAVGWSALTGVRFTVEAASPEPTVGLVLELRRAPDEEPALILDVPAGDLHEGAVTVASPLALTPATPGVQPAIDVRFRPSGQGIPPRIGVTAAGEVALVPEGISTATTPEVRLGGQPLFDAAAAVSLPSQASIDVRADDRARMRVGPWTPGLLLRNATGQTGWSLPGPSADPGTWTDSVIKTAAGGGSLVVRVDAPWPIRSATASVMLTSLVRELPAAVAIDGSTDGSSFAALATYEPESIVRQQLATGQLSPSADTTSVWFAIDLVGGPATTGINALWFDLQLAPPEGTTALLASIPSRQLDVSPMPVGSSGAAPPVTVDVAVDPSVAERVAWTANDAIRAAISAPGPLLFLLLAVGLLGAAWFAARAAGRAAAVGLLALAVVAAGSGDAGLPRSVLLPRTQSLEDGVLDGAMYVSPIISIPVGSSVDRVAVDGQVDGATISVRTVATDGTPGPWVDPGAGVPADGDGLQVRVEFGSAGSRVDRIKVDFRPPLGS